MKGKKIKQINNLTIRYTEEYQYSVWTPDGRCWEDRMTLEQAEEFCRNTKDFVSRQNYYFKLELNREYISGWKINLSAFIIGKLEVDIYAEHKSIRND